MQPPFRENLRPDSVMGGIKRLGKDSLIKFRSSFLLILCYFPEFEHCQLNYFSAIDWVIEENPGISGNA